RGRSVVPYDADYARRSAADSTVSMYERARRAGEAVTRKAEETEDAFRDRVAETRAGILGVQQDVSETAAAFADRVQSAFDTAQQTAREKMERMRSSTGEWRDSIMEQGQRTGEAVAGAAQRGRDYAVRAGGSIAETVSENPLLLGVFGRHGRCASRRSGTAD